MSAPIIFTHYGNTPYLTRTLKCARITNPDCHIILLGDDSNRQTALQAGVDHLCFNKLIAGPRRQEFSRSFQPINGRQHRNYKNGGYWLRYVFERWFYVYEYALSREIKSFWHFDSDTMILVSLDGFENIFERYDCTEQCEGTCMNGYVHLHTLASYLDVINALFGDDFFLESQRREFEIENPHYAFTEMTAYAEAKKRNVYSTVRLSEIIKGTSFDDCICQDHGYETVRIGSGQIIKNVYWDDGFYCSRKGLDRPVKFNTLNLSWVPDFVFDWVLARITRDTHNDGDFSRRCYLASCSAPIVQVVLGQLRMMKSWAKNAIENK